MTIAASVARAAPTAASPGPVARDPHSREAEKQRVQHEDHEQESRHPAHGRGDGGAHERRGTQGVQFAAFCFVFATIVRYLIDTGGVCTASDTKASQMSDLDVAGTRANLLRSRKVRGVEKESPPESWNTSTATMLGVFAVEVQEKYVPRLPAPNPGHGPPARRCRPGCNRYADPDHYS